MGLKLKFDIKKHIAKIIWAIIIAVIAVFVIRVAVWEKNYYDSKEGSARAISPSTVGSIEVEEVDETEITEDAFSSWTVPATNPRYITIDKLGVKSRVVPISVKDNGQLGTPVSIYDAGWYNNSATPGSGGIVLLDGHNGGPTKTGIFKNLPSLVAGDEIHIERGDGKVYTYKVVDNVTVPLAEADAKMAWAERSPLAGVESVSIISCTGEWSDAQKTYLSRQFLRAVLVKSA